MIRSLRRFFSGAIVLFACLVLASVSDATAQDDDIGDACLDDLRDEDASTIACDLPFILPDREREAMSQLTAGFLLDAACVVNVDIGRRSLVGALLNEDLLAIPRQPVNCEIATEGEPLMTRFTLSPQVWFEDGRAVRANPGMDDLVGLPNLVGRLIMDWVNKSGTIEDAMVDAVNDYIENGLPE